MKLYFLLVIIYLSICLVQCKDFTYIQMVVDPASNTYPCVPDPSISCPDILNSLNAYYPIQNTTTVLNLLLKQGVYSGVNNTNILFSNACTIIIGPNGNDKVTIDLQSNGNFITFPPLESEVSKVTLQNINIVNGNSENGGVFLINSTQSFVDLIINNVTFSNNKAVNGGILYAKGSLLNNVYVTFDQASFINNTASEDGTVFYSITNAYLSFTNCLFQQNFGTSMIYAINTDFVLVNSTIDSNIGNNSLVNLAYNDPCTITNNIFTNNSLMTYGGLIKSYSNKPIISNSVMANNTADTLIIYQTVQFYTMNVINTTFDSNKLIYGALYINPRGTVNVKNSTFSRNVGGAIYYYNTMYPETIDVVISNSRFIDNIAVNSSATDIFAKNITLYLSNDYFQSALPTSNTSAPIFCDNSIVNFNGITSNTKDNMIMNCRSTSCTVTGASANVCPNNGGGGKKPNKKDDNGFSSGAIAGIIIGVIAGILLVGLLIYIAYKRHHNRHKYLSYN